MTPPDAPTQQQASALLTVTARDPGEQAVGRAFSSAAIEIALGSYPGFHLLAPPGRASQYGVFTPGYVPQDAVAHEVVLPDGESVAVDPPRRTLALEPLPGRPSDSAGFDGPTREIPLGVLAGARSGDKGGNANIGVWVRNPDAYPWLSGFLTTERVRELIPEARDLDIRVSQLPNLSAVNIVIEGLLGEGVAYNNRFDPQAKGLAEWLRSREVPAPIAFLEEDQP